jgi:hypothetical protein
MLQILFILLMLGSLMAGDFKQVRSVESSDNYKLVRSVEVEGDMHGSDPMGNVYIVKKNTLKKFSNQHKQAAYYTNAFLGNIHTVDVSDPLRILIFYKDYNQVVWVDNFLSEIRSPIRLDDLGIDQVQLVCSSAQGGFWVFNSLNNQLQYFDVNLQLVHESPTLNMLTGPDIDPTYMTEKSRQLYLNVPGTGILLFDRFGNYAKTLGIEIPGNFQVTDRYIYFFREGKLFNYDLKTAEVALIDMPLAVDLGGINNKKNPILNAQLQPGLLFLFTEKGYSVFNTK